MTDQSVFWVFWAWELQWRGDRVLVRQWHESTSLWSASAEIHSWVWQVDAVNDQSSAHSAFPRDLNLIHELLLVVGLSGIVAESHQAQLSILSLLVPEHHIQLVVIVTTFNFYPVRHIGYFGQRLLKLHTLGSICGRRDSKYGCYIHNMSKKRP